MPQIYLNMEKCCGAVPADARRIVGGGEAEMEKESVSVGLPLSLLVALAFARFTLQVPPQEQERG